MSQRPSWSTLVLGLGLVAPLGCASLHAPVSNLLTAGKPSEPVAKAPIELPPERAGEVCLAAAQELEKTGYETDAIAQYEKARQQNPRLTQVSRRLAVLYDRQCDYTKAEAEYKRAVKLFPRDADLLNDVGYFYYERGDWAEAEKWLRQAVAINAGHQRAWTNLGLVLGQQERYEESYQAFVKVVNPAQAQGNVGIILAKQGKMDEAKQKLRQALTQEPDLKPARVVLAKLEAPQGMTPDSPAAAGVVPVSKER
jgi:Tfp pilus assembly protein PilF